MNRRQLIRTALATGLLATTRTRAAGAAPTKFRDDPFTLGIASGEPTADRVVLWTRLAPEPLAPLGGLTAPFIPVDWVLAEDERLQKVVRSGTAYATPDWAYSIHVEIIRLDPGRTYWYRFTAGGVQSPIGRTRTAPAAGAALDRLRFAVASCQQYEHGYYGAYRHMLDDDLDFIVHVGDYIYEESWGVAPFVRQHPQREVYTLDDYRAQYALYKQDPDLRAAHAAYPWFVTWDDHEVENDHAGDHSINGDDPAWFHERRAAAYRAYYEHQPLPRRAMPFGAGLRLHTGVRFGDLANLILLDTRQYRSVWRCPPPPERYKVLADCRTRGSDGETMLGERQERWFDTQLATNRTRWSFVAQGVVMSHIDEQPGPGRRYWPDAWNGYPAARQRLLDTFTRRETTNPVILSGDIHSFLVGGINATSDDLSTRMLASEFVTTSISSQGMPEERIEGFRRENPNLLFGTSASRGYLRLALTPKRLETDLVAMERTDTRDTARKTLATFVVEDGVAGPVRA
ncbi:MAG: Alkaline phosphatase D [Steroidobacteraceae bacterium]|nr:Alkaline phosphatase D [Steroidobacteraceae bacterium]